MKTQYSHLFKPTTYYLFILAITMFSCTHKYYAPNEADVLGLRKKHDTHASAAIGDLNRSFQVAYSPFKHIGIAGSYFHIKQKNRRNPEKRGFGHIYNGSIGGYHFFPTGKYLYGKQGEKTNPFFMNPGILAEVYIGMSKGQVFNFYDSRGRSKFDFNKRYLHIGGHIFFRLWGISYVFRTGSLNYYKAHLLGNIVIDEQIGLDILLNERNNYLISEHTMKIHFGKNDVRLFVTASEVFSTQKLEDVGIFNATFNIGVLIEFDEFFRKKNK